MTISHPENHWKNSFWIDLIICAGLAGLIILLHWPLWASREIDQVFLAPGDTTSFFYPAAWYGVSQFWQGQLALWAPYVLGGQPFAAQLQTQALYPIRWLSALLHFNREYTYTSYASEVVAHLVITAWGTYFYFKRLSQNRAAGVFGAVAWGLGGYLTGYLIQQFPLLASAAWLPWLLLGLDYWLSDDAMTDIHLRLRGLTLSVGAWAMSLLGGMPQISLYISIIVLVNVVSQTHFRAHWGRSLARTGIALAFGIALAAPLLLPALELIPYAERTQWSFAKYAGGFEVQDLWGVIYPRLTLWSPLYVGSVTLLLIAIGASLLRRQPQPHQPNSTRLPRMRFWWGLLLFGLLISLGGNSAVYPLLYRAVAAFALFRNQERAVILIVWALIMIVILGWRTWADKAEGLQIAARSKLIWVTILWAALLGAARLWTSFQPVSEYPRLHVLLSNATWPWLMWTVALLWLRFAPIGPRLTQWGLVMLLVIDIGSIAWQTADQTHWVRRDNPPYAEIAQLVPFSQADLTNPTKLVRAKPPYRLDSRGLLKGDWTLIAGIEDLHGQMVQTLDYFVRFRAQVPGERVWALMGIGCFGKSKEELELPFEADTVAELTVEGKAVQIKCLKTPFERYRVVYKTLLVPTPEAAIGPMRDANFNPLDTVILQQAVNLPSIAPTVPAKITLKSWQPQATTLLVTSEQVGVLVLGDLWYPGWWATIDGQPVEVLRAYSALRAVAVPAGSHEIVVFYAPATFYIGLGMAGLAALLLALMAFRSKLTMLGLFGVP
jgi:hypothetical protein